MMPRLLLLHPSTYQRLVRLSKEAERDGAYRISGDPAGAAIQGIGVAAAVSDRWCRWTAGRVPVGPAIGDDREATATVRRYSRQRSGCLRSGYRHLDVAHDCLGDRAGVRRSVSSWPCAQIASWMGIFSATASPRTGPRRRCGARPMAPPHLSCP